MQLQSFFDLFYDYQKTSNQLNLKLHAFFFFKGILCYIGTFLYSDYSVPHRVGMDH